MKMPLSKMKKMKCRNIEEKAALRQEENTLANGRHLIKMRIVILQKIKGPTINIKTKSLNEKSGREGLQKSGALFLNNLNRDFVMALGNVCRLY